MRLGPRHVVVDVELDAPVPSLFNQAERAVLQRREAGLAHHALEHHAPADRRGDRVSLELLGALALVQAVLDGDLDDFIEASLKQGV